MVMYWDPVSCTSALRTESGKYRALAAQQVHAANHVILSDLTLDESIFFYFHSYCKVRSAF